MAPSCSNVDIVIGFDKDQVVGKTYTVQPNNKVRSSVVTTTAFIQLDATGALQTNENFSPGVWLGDQHLDKFP